MTPVGVAAAAGVMIAVAAGCSDPKYRAKRAMRDDHIEQVDRWVSDMEKLRPGHIEWLGNSVERMEDRRPAHLEKTANYAGRRIVNEAKWYAMQPQYEDWGRRVVDGRPHCIPNAWANIAY